MVSVTQRIKQYNPGVGQPRGGLIKPSMMTVSRLAMGVGGWPWDLPALSCVVESQLDTTDIATRVIRQA
ncbi:hypothetical protein FM104_03800 [Microbacterium esteraromaticum]|uniref:Uncharacterized protein n=1 Tax=Microbacterium esteraromaticum TaxID=57043 RepID=A0A1R4ITE6_9MICO|nr:hypothetical protein [Microbacterium esteraromaticum]SJN22949.1 hypothetical protein FM104_03800 [Microbacterium esteraromaticum]